MKERIVFLGVIVVLAGLSVNSFLFGHQEPPPGIEAERWIAITNDLGLVLQTAQETGPLFSPPSTKQLRGVLMVRQNGHWQSVWLEPCPGTPKLVPARTP
ncbi:MAG: hypothetical protein AB1898_15680 [Acidobacteriota bacterium]